MSDFVEKIVDYSGPGMIINALGGDAGGGAAKMFGGGEQGGTTIVNEKTVTQENSIEAQSAQRRLARLSRYFTSPSGVLDAPTGSQGVF